MKGDPWQAGANATEFTICRSFMALHGTATIMTGDFLVQLNHKIGDFSGKLILGNSMYSQSKTGICM